MFSRRIDKETDSIGGTVPEYFQQGLSVFSQGRKHGGFVSQDNDGIRQKLGEAIVQRVKVSAVVDREAESLSQIQMGCPPVSHPGAIQSDDLHVYSPP
jgi:hypothetical protein